MPRLLPLQEEVEALGLTASMEKRTSFQFILKNTTTTFLLIIMNNNTSLGDAM